MLVILEGVDLAGKSTLACGLTDRLGAALIHRGPPIEHPLYEYERTLLANYVADGSRGHVVCDRLHWGEAIYPQVLGRETQLTPAVWRHVNLFLASRGALVVHVHAPLSTLLERHEERGDDLVEANHLLELLNRYRELASSSTLPVVSFQSHPLDPLPNGDSYLTNAQLLIAARAEYEQHRVTHLAEFPAYVGPPAPTFLLLGERPGPTPPSREPLDLPFASFPATSGAYLLNCLPERVWPLCGLANACDSSVNVEDLWDALGHPQVVALGRLAQRECERLTLPHGTAPHPQFWRRFRFHEAPRYAEAILRAAACQEVVPSWT